MARKPRNAPPRRSRTGKSPGAESESPRASAKGPAVALAAGLVPALLVLLHMPGVNGTPYWPWRYGNAPVAPFLAIAGLGFAAVWAASERFRATGRARLPLAVLACVHVILIFSFTALTDEGLAVVGDRVRHPDITSYHTVAARLDDVSDWLAHYEERLPQMIGHTQTHPPGPVLYYWLWNRLFGMETGADAGGLFLGLFAGLAIPLVFLAGSRALGEARSAFWAAMAWTPLPALVIMLGSFDAVYPVFTLGSIALWARAVWDEDLRAAAVFGALLAVALFFTHSFLVLGALFVLMGLASRKWAAFARASVVALGVLVGLFLLAKGAVGYDHLAALQTSMLIQEGLAGAWNRPWRMTVIWDVYDFFLASGWAPAAVLALFLVRWAKGGLADAERLRWFALAAVGALAIVDLSGLLRAETARVWLFLQPLALLLVGAELSRWPPGWRAALVGVLFFALAAIRARLIFI